MENIHAMLPKLYEERQRPQGSSEVTGMGTRKRKVRTEDEFDLAEENEERESSQPRELEAGQDQIKFKNGWFYRVEHYFLLHFLNEKE